MVSPILLHTVIPRVSMLSFTYTLPLSGSSCGNIGLRVSASVLSLLIVNPHKDGKDCRDFKFVSIFVCFDYCQSCVICKLGYFALIFIQDNT